MSEENIFNEDQSLENEVPPEQNPLPPELADLVGEGKKYKTMQDALKSIPHAQNHIQKLEEDLSKYKEEVAKAKAMEELLEEFKQQAKESQYQPPAEPLDQRPPVDIDSAVEAALARKEAQRAAKANAEVVIKAFKDTFGDEGEARFIQLAQENGLPIPYLNTLAQTSPSAVLKLAGLTKSAAPSVPHSASSVNTEANFSSNQELSARVNMVGASSKDVTQAWKNARLKAEKLING